MSSSGDKDLPSHMAGPEGVAGEFLLSNVLSQADIDERTREVIFTNLAGVLPGRLVPPGTVVDRRTFSPDQLRQLIRVAAVPAAGLDPAKTSDPPPPVLWEEGGNRLLVNIADLSSDLRPGLVEITVPVYCDQTGDTKVTVTFVSGAPGRPTGGVTTTEDHPRGPAVIVETWHEPLIALAWRALLIATSAMSGVGGTDRSGRVLITNAVELDADGLSVLPMARHTFIRTETLP